MGEAPRGEEDVTPRVRHCLLVGEASNIRLADLNFFEFSWKRYYDLEIFTLH